MSDSVLDDGLGFSGSLPSAVPPDPTGGDWRGPPGPPGPQGPAGPQGPPGTPGSGGGGGSGDYVLPIATTSTLGGVKPDGTTITATFDGTITATATGGSTGVTSFNGRTGAVNLSSGDVSAALAYTPYNASNPSGYQNLAQVTALVPQASTTAPLMDSLAAYGNASTWARADHVHPSDTSRLPTSGGTISGSLTVTSSLSVNGTVQANGTLGVSGLAAFAYPTVTDFYMTRSAGNRQLHWSNTDSLNWTESNGYFSEVHSGTVIFSVDPSGNLAINGANANKPSGSASWIVTSDDRVKQNVVPYDTGLDAVCQLEPIVFEYNGEGGTEAAADGSKHIGLSAQTTQAIMPELVVEAPVTANTLPSQLAMDYGPLTLALVNAVRELAARVAALEAGR